MSLQYIIDGYNLTNHQLFKTCANKKIRDSRAALLELIRVKRLCGSPKNRVAVVFDGYPTAEARQGFNTEIEVIFAGAHSADERIKRLVEDCPCPKNIRIVSDDKEIRLCVRALGAGVLSVEEFVSPGRNSSRPQEKEPLKTELSYEAMHKINQELRKIWLE